LNFTEDAILFIEFVLFCFGLGVLGFHVLLSYWGIEDVVVKTMYGE